MKIVREKTEILLMEYAAGALDEACSLLVASYITLCPEARRYVYECEALGGALIKMDCAPVAMHDGSLNSVLNRIEAGECAGGRTPAGSEAGARLCRDHPLPQPLSFHINDRCRNARWRYFSPGTKFCALPVGDNAHSAALFCMAPGARAPRHCHDGNELTLVLKGGYHDEYGHYRAGELVIADEQITHQPVANPEGCLCIIVTDAPLPASSAFHRVLNIFFKVN